MSSLIKSKGGAPQWVRDIIDPFKTGPFAWEKHRIDEEALAKGYDDPDGLQRRSAQGLRDALAGLRGNESATSALAQQAMSQDARAAGQRMRMGGPAQASQALAALQRAQAGRGQRAGMVLAREESELDDLLQRAYGGQQRADLNDALREMKTRELVRNFNLGLDQSQMAQNMNAIASMGGLLASNADAIGREGAAWWDRVTAPSPAPAAPDPYTNPNRGSYRPAPVGGY